VGEGTVGGGGLPSSVDPILRSDQVTLSTDYQLSGLEIVVGKDKKKATGTFITRRPVERGQERSVGDRDVSEPWKLTNVQVR